jgi:hypothetical protein
VTHKGETKVIEVERDQVRGLGGGVGLLGGTPNGDVETQTNRSESAASGDVGSSQTAGSLDVSSPTPSGRSDGGSSTTDISSPLDAPTEPRTPAAPDGPSRRNGSDGSGGRSTTDATAREGPGDTYCGNCAEFDYVKTDDGMRPYCGHYDEVMEAMEPCEQWTPR